jgi:hypothetical protein
MARQRITDGRLPLLFSGDITAGYGNGSRCCLCELPIEKQHVEYEVPDGESGRTLSMHLSCHAAWQLECVAIAASSKPRRENLRR